MRSDAAHANDLSSGEVSKIYRSGQRPPAAYRGRMTQTDRSDVLCQLAPRPDGQPACQQRPRLPGLPLLSGPYRCPAESTGREVQSDKIRALTHWESQPVQHLINPLVIGDATVVSCNSLVVYPAHRLHYPPKSNLPPAYQIFLQQPKAVPLHTKCWSSTTLRSPRRWAFRERS